MVACPKKNGITGKYGPKEPCKTWNFVLVEVHALCTLVCRVIYAVFLHCIPVSVVLVD